MKQISILGWQITIRKIRAHHPMDTQGYKRDNDKRVQEMARRLKLELGSIEA